MAAVEGVAGLRLARSLNPVILRGMAVDPIASAPTPVDARQRMQRVRVGVTGLAAVVLVLALATAIATGVRRTVTTGNGSTAEQQISLDSKPKADNVIDPDSEPLAQLGVAPVAKNDASRPAGKATR